VTPAPPGPQALAEAAAPREHLLDVPGGALYYQTRGNGPALVLLGGGPSNADTLGPLAGQLARDCTVVTYDRRGYSRSRQDDAGEQVGIPGHGRDLIALLTALAAAPVSLFGTSFGALVALEGAASAPGLVGTLIVHEPPLGQLLAGDQRKPFDLDLDARPDAGAALDAIAASIGVTRGAAAGTSGRRGPRAADVETFIRRDAPAIGAYHLDLARLDDLRDRTVVTGSEDGRAFYPYQCALSLAGSLGTQLVELPGNHAGMIQDPAPFAARLRLLLNSPTGR
jgi:pimeloyl-ACP methyl ester carboxylesterase